MIQLKENSITARLYRWFYNHESMPKNLCPYFWKVVIMYVFILPYTVYCAPVLFVPFLKRFRETVETPTIMVSAFVYLFMFLLYSVFVVLFKFLGFTVNKDIFVLGCITLCVIVAIGLAILIYLGIMKIKDTRETMEWKKEHSDEPVKVPKFFMLIEFVKATYYKYCPQITWRN